jgi:hypothetical protein
MRMKWTGHVARMGEINRCKVLVGEPDIERSMSIWDDNIQIRKNK